VSRDVLCYSVEEAAATIAAALSESARMTVTCRPMEGFVLVSFWDSDKETSPTE
jgi:hypothetical protein